jgi:hypothetical protein
MPMIGKALLFLLLATPLHAQIAIPVVGRPIPFYGAAGHDVRVEVKAEPTTLTLDQELLYTITLRNLANPSEVSAPPLDTLDSFRDYQVVLDKQPTEAATADSRTFRYRLRPRGKDISSIPSWTYPYFDHTIAAPPDRPGFPFRKARTASIPIQIITAPPPESPKIAPMPLTVPSFADSTANRPSWKVPDWFWATALLGIPGVLALGVWLWHWVIPDAARRAHHRRSRAARLAIKSIRSLGSNAAPEPLVQTMLHYLTLHFGWHGSVQLPSEIERELRQAGQPKELIEEIVAFFKKGDEARFSPRSRGRGESLASDAETLINRLEETA